MDDDETAGNRLRFIAYILDITVERFYDLQSTGDLDDASECLRLWYAIKTDEGRAAGLDALKKIAAEESR